jgi:hypothetical protein
MRLYREVALDDDSSRQRSCSDQRLSGEVSSIGSDNTAMFDRSRC